MKVLVKVFRHLDNYNVPQYEHSETALYNKFLILRENFRDYLN